MTVFRNIIKGSCEKWQTNLVWIALLWLTSMSMTVARMLGLSSVRYIQACKVAAMKSAIKFVVTVCCCLVLGTFSVCAQAEDVGPNEDFIAFQRQGTRIFSYGPVFVRPKSVRESIAYIPDPRTNGADFVVEEEFFREIAKVLELQKDAWGGYPCSPSKKGPPPAGTYRFLWYLNGKRNDHCLFLKDSAVLFGELNRMSASTDVPEFGVYVAEAIATFEQAPE